MSPADPFGLVGQVLDGQFRVDRYVGEGGFSSVYRGTHLGLTEPIAIKCLKLPAALGSALVESFVKRFRDESRLHYKLSQGNLHIVRSVASGTTTAPTTSALVPYIVLEWLEGRSLAEDFGHRRARGLRGRPLPEVVKLLDSAVDAMAYAHAQGVVHRDLNPGNLFLARTPWGDKLKVLDFGVAKILADSALAMGPTVRTLGNIRMFAPAYGAPEQFDERVGAIGPWTDVYSLVLVILEALTDRSVVEGEHIGEFATKTLDEMNRPSPRALGVEVGDEVQRVLAMAASLRPADRPRDAGELWGMLKHAMRVDADSVRPREAERTGSESPPRATLRIDSSTPPFRPPGPPGARGVGGTLHMPRGPAVSASAALARIPPPPSATSPLPTPTPVPVASGQAAPSPPPPARRGPVIALSVLVVVALAAVVWLLVAHARHARPGAQAMAQPGATCPIRCLVPFSSAPAASYRAA